MAHAPCKHTDRVAAARFRRKPVRLADELGAGAVATVTQRSGAAARTKTAMTKHMRRRVGFGRSARRAPQRGRAGFGVPFAHVCMGAAYSFSCRREGAVAGTGLFTETALKARATLGAFTGQVLAAAEARARRARRVKSLLSFKTLEGKRAWIDGSAGRASCFVWLNSSRGTGRTANVELCVQGEQLLVRTLVAIAPGTELLADYAWA